MTGFSTLKESATSILEFAQLQLKLDDVITLQLCPSVNEINPDFPDSLLNDHPLDLAFLYMEEQKVNFLYRDSYKCIKSICSKTSGVIKYFIDTTQVILLGFTLSFTHMFEWYAFLCINEFTCVWLHLYVPVFIGAILNFFFNLDHSSPYGWRQDLSLNPDLTC